MTNYDMEQRLRRAAADLPEPKGGLTAAEQTKARRRRSPMVYVAAAVIVVALLIPTAYGVYKNCGFSCRSVGTSLVRVEEYGFCYPMALGEYDEIEYVYRTYAVPEPEKGEYDWINMTYRNDSAQALLLTVGSTGGEVWKEALGFEAAEQGWKPSALYHGDQIKLEALNIVEYQDCCICLYDKVTRDNWEKLPISEWCDAAAIWVDEEAGLAFRLEWNGAIAWESVDDDGNREYWQRSYQMLTQDELLEYVKLIIDAQR